MAGMMRVRQKQANNSIFRGILVLNGIIVFFFLFCFSSLENIQNSNCGIFLSTDRPVKYFEFYSQHGTELLLFSKYLSIKCF